MDRPTKMAKEAVSTIKSEQKQQPVPRVKPKVTWWRKYARHPEALGCLMMWLCALSWNKSMVRWFRAQIRKQFLACSTTMHFLTNLFSVSRTWNFLLDLGRILMLCGAASILMASCDNFWSSSSTDYSTLWAMSAICLMDSCWRIQITFCSWNLQRLSPSVPIQVLVQLGDWLCYSIKTLPEK